MRKFWLLDQHGGKGPTALVETNGSLQVVSVIRFGPGITELADQQAILDKVLGKVAPTLKPAKPAGQVDEEGVAPHEDLEVGGSVDAKPGGQAGTDPSSSGGGRVGGGPSNKGSRGDR